mgnify:CR=1 FL=1
MIGQLVAGNHAMGLKGRRLLYVYIEASTNHRLYVI